jgi:hypothetical protein
MMSFTAVRGLPLLKRAIVVRHQLGRTAMVADSMDQEPIFGAHGSMRKAVEIFPQLAYHGKPRY